MTYLGPEEKSREDCKIRIDIGSPKNFIFILCHQFT